MELRSLYTIFTMIGLTRFSIPVSSAVNPKKLIIAVIVGRRITNTDGGKAWSYGTDGTLFGVALGAICTN